MLSSRSAQGIIIFILIYIGLFKDLDRLFTKLIFIACSILLLFFYFTDTLIKADNARDNNTSAEESKNQVSLEVTKKHISRWNKKRNAVYNISETLSQSWKLGTDITIEIENLINLVTRDYIKFWLTKSKNKNLLDLTISALISLIFCF